MYVIEDLEILFEEIKDSINNKNIDDFEKYTNEFNNVLEFLYTSLSSDTLENEY